MDRVLKLKTFPHRKCHFKSEKWVLRCIAEVQEEGPVRFENTAYLGSPLATPFQVARLWLIIVIVVVILAKIVGWRSDNNVNRLRVDLLHALNAIAKLDCELHA